MPDPKLFTVMLSIEKVQIKSKPALSACEIVEVKDEHALQAFVNFPFQLYQNQPNWIPPLHNAEMASLSPDKNPAFEHAKVKLFLAKQKGGVVGRVAVLVNDLETKHLGEKHARFGWFDFVDDESVSQALLEAAENWAVAQGASLLKGPLGFNTLDKNGLLVAGFDSLGTANTLYNYCYYAAHLDRLGFEKDLEWIEQKMTLPAQLPPKVGHAAQIAQQRYHLQLFKPKSKQDLQALGAQFFQLVHETYSKLPGFVPISEKQQADYTQHYIGFIPPKYVCVVKNAEGEAIGFGLTMPSLSEAMRKANGRLLPFGFLHLLAAKHWNKNGDLTLIGVKEAWRRRGVPGVIMAELFKTFQQAGITNVRINPMLEFNQNVLALWKEFGCEIYKRRRTYKKML